MAIAERCPVGEFATFRESFLEEDPFAGLSKFRECQPFWCPKGGLNGAGFWVFTRYGAGARDSTGLPDDFHA